MSLEAPDFVDSKYSRTAKGAGSASDAVTLRPQRNDPRLSIHRVRSAGELELEKGGTRESDESTEVSSLPSDFVLQTMKGTRSLVDAVGKQADRASTMRNSCSRRDAAGQFWIRCVRSVAEEARGSYGGGEGGPTPFVHFELMCQGTWYWRTVLNYSHRRRSFRNLTGAATGLPSLCQVIRDAWGRR